MDLWKKTQVKVFTKWTNYVLRDTDTRIELVTRDFASGVKLIALVEALNKAPLNKKWHPEPKNRVQALDNCSVALEHIENEFAVRLVGIGAADIVDMNEKLTLGLIWSLILKFQIESIADEGVNSRDRLLAWAHNVANVSNFTTAWQDGRAFCGVVAHYFPELIDFHRLDGGEPTDFLEEAFKAFATLSIPTFLDIQDLLMVQSPDEKSIVTQVSQLYHFFTSDRKVQEAQSLLTRHQAFEGKLDRLIGSASPKIRDLLTAFKEKLDDEHRPCSLCSELLDIIAATQEKSYHDAPVQTKKLKLSASTSSSHIACDNENYAGIKLYYGHGELENKETAISHFKASSELKNPEGYFNYAKAVESTNTELAISLYQHAANMDHVPSMNNLATIYMRLNQHSEAFSLYADASSYGSIVAMANLSICYHKGLGTQVNDQLAFQLNMQAAEAGLPKALCNAGYFYQYGIGVVKNLHLAIKYYDLAAQKHYPAAYHNLSLLKEGLEKEHILRRGAEYKSPHCLNNLGVTQVQRNDPESIISLKASAERGLPTSLYNYGLSKMSQHQYLAAFNCFRKAADAGMKEAINNYAYCVANGYGVKANTERAHRILTNS